MAIFCQTRRKNNVSPWPKPISCRIFHHFGLIKSVCPSTFSVTRVVAPRRPDITHLGGMVIFQLMPGQRHFVGRNST